jgi:hypothetical protein
MESRKVIECLISNASSSFTISLSFYTVLNNDNDNNINNRNEASFDLILSINRYSFESRICDSIVFTKLVSHMLGSPLFYHSNTSL